MSSRGLFQGAALLALVLLSLPGAAGAQTTALIRGQVRYADGSVAAGATVYAQPLTGSGPAVRATVDAAGQYQVRVPAGNYYDLGVEFSGPGYACAQTVVTSLGVGYDTVRDLTTSDMWLHGRIVDSRGLPVAGVKVSGSGVGLGHSANRSVLSPVSGADGRFQVRMLAGTYYNTLLDPPRTTGYALTPLWYERFTASVSRDFVVVDAVRITGQLRYSDGSAAAGAIVFAQHSTNVFDVEATTDANGMYSLPVAPAGTSYTYSLGAGFTVPGFTGTRMLMTGLAINAHTVQHLNMGDIWIQGTVRTRDGLPAAGVELQGLSDPGRFKGTANVLSPVSGADGRFLVRTLPASYPSLNLRPPEGSGYLFTQLSGYRFTESGSWTFIVNTPVTLSGQVRFSDWIGVSGATVIARSTYHHATATADAGGLYQLALAPNATYDVRVRFSVPGFSGYQELGSVAMTTNALVRDLALPDVWLHGRVVNSNGQPLAGVKLSGTRYGVEDSFLSPESGADGRFQVRVLPGTYSSMRMTPVPGSGYQLTYLPNEVINGSLSKDYVVNDVNECAQNNGGCSVNATCTNRVGSHSCACKAGYSGDGVTCVETTKALAITSPNGGEQWTSGTVRSITWASEAVSSVHLHYSLDNGSSWVLIAANMPASPGSYAWTLPAGVTSTGARVRIADAQTGSPVDVSDAAFSVTSPGRVILNEILANEAGSATAGEFIELVNVGGSPVDLSGWTLWDATAARHAFAPGTVLAPGRALVVFGSASGIPAEVPDAVGSSSGTLSLNNTGDTVVLKDAAGTSIDAYTYSSALAAADGVSMNLGPDATPGAAFVLHHSLSVRLSSAGSRVDGTAF